MPKDLAVILNKGGINSAVATALAAQKHRTILLHAGGAVANDARQNAFEQQVGHFRPYRHHLLSCETDASAALSHTGQDAHVARMADPRHAAPLAPQMIELLPIISMGVRLAAHYEAAAIYLGLCTGPGGDELAQATEYLQIWNELIQMPCGRGELELVAPLLELESWQVIDVGVQVKAPFEYAWSCLEEAPRPCRGCRGCRAREQAFLQAGKADPQRAG